MSTQFRSAVAALSEASLRSLRVSPGEGRFPDATESGGKMNALTSRKAIAVRTCEEATLVEPGPDSSRR